MQTSPDGNASSNDVPFNVVIKKIERYVALTAFDFANSIDTHDLFDLTLSSTSKQIKCILHPSLNKYVYLGTFKDSSIIQITDYSCHLDETETLSKELFVIKSLNILDKNASISSPTNSNIFRMDYPRNKPLITLREYYLPLYNDIDIYGRIWDTHLKKMNITNLGTSRTSIQTLRENKSTARLLPITGTVVTKSRLAHFGKKHNSNKYPFVFSIEIEHNGFSCSVSFWNKSCLNYFKNIEIGQNLILFNYRLKRRYNGKRSNTVFGPSKDSGIELSINPAKPTGEVHLLDDQTATSNIIYKFKTSAYLKNPLLLDSIIDVVGCVCFIGRFEREKKQHAYPPINSGSFWMYRWILVKDFTSLNPIKIKVYACSQNYKLENLSLGDVFIATRMLYKVSCIQHCGKQKYFPWVTTTRESQLYRIARQWQWNQVKLFPFACCKEVLDILKLSQKNSDCEKLLCHAYTGGYFSYPPLSHTINNYRSSFPTEAPLQMISTDELNNLINHMHVYQMMRVCIQATVAVIEIIGGEQTSTSPYHIIDKDALQLCDNIKKIGDLDILTEGTKTRLLGCKDDINSCTFMRLCLVNLNKNNCIVSYFVPEFHEQSNCKDIIEVLHGGMVTKNQLHDMFQTQSQCMKVGERLMFVLDIYYHNHETVEIIVNRAFQL